MSADVITSFLDAMEAAGVVPETDIAADLGPKKIYFRCAGDKKGRKSGWAKLYLDSTPAGSFGSYKLGVAEKWRFSDGRTLTPAERLRLKREFRLNAERREAEQMEKWLEVANACRQQWADAGPADPAHGYLESKGIDGEGLRQTGSCLLVPMLDADGAIWNLQRIYPNGRKLYVAEARTKALHMVIGNLGQCVVVAEGYGTGAVIRRATGLPVAVAFTWTNLETVARMMRETLPNSDIVIAADDDAHLVDHPHIKRNIGLDAARAAAEAVGGRLAVPPRN